MDKVYQKINEAIADVNDGAMIAIAGFFACGVPRLLIQALIDKKVKNLTLTCGCGPLVGASDELKQLVKNGQLKKSSSDVALLTSFSRPNRSRNTSTAAGFSMSCLKVLRKTAPMAPSMTR